MKISYQPTLVPAVPRAVTLNYADDDTPARSITMFNAAIVTSIDPSSKAVTATVTRVDGDGVSLSDAAGVIEASATDPASEDAAIKAAGGILAPRVLPPPTVGSVSPGVGAAAGGETVTVAGTNLIGATAVTFGGTPPASFAVVSGQKITAVVPAGAAGPVDVTVTVPGGTATAKGAFKYE